MAMSLPQKDVLEQTTDLSQNVFVQPPKLHSTFQILQQHLQAKFQALAPRKLSLHYGFHHTKGLLSYK